MIDPGNPPASWRSFPLRPTAIHMRYARHTTAQPRGRCQSPPRWHTTKAPVDPRVRRRVTRSPVHCLDGRKQRRHMEPLDETPHQTHPDRPAKARPGLTGRHRVCMRSANRSCGTPTHALRRRLLGQKSKSPSSPDAINRPLTRIRHGDSGHCNKNGQYLVGPSQKIFKLRAMACKGEAGSAGRAGGNPRTSARRGIDALR